MKLYVIVVLAYIFFIPIKTMEYSNKPSRSEFMKRLEEKLSLRPKKKSRQKVKLSRAKKRISHAKKFGLSITSEESTSNSSRMSNLKIEKKERNKFKKRLSPVRSRKRKHHRRLSLEKIRSKSNRRRKKSHKRSSQIQGQGGVECLYKKVCRNIIKIFRLSKEENDNQENIDQFFNLLKITTQYFVQKELQINRLNGYISKMINDEQQRNNICFAVERVQAYIKDNPKKLKDSKPLAFLALGNEMTAIAQYSMSSMQEVPSFFEKIATLDEDEKETEKD